MYNCVTPYVTRRGRVARHPANYKYVLDFSITLIALVSGLVATLAMRKVCASLGHVDHPGGRKQHLQATPLCGGFAIALTVLIIGGAVAFSREYIGLVLGMLMLAGIGAFDDVRPLSARYRMGVQVLAVIVGMLLLGNISITHLGRLVSDTPLVLGGMAGLFTVIAIVGLMNAVNMIDGVDGLAGGYSLLVFITLAVAGTLTGGATHPIIYILIGAIVGFLAFNMRTPWRGKASIFLGDAGSLILGFCMAWFAVDLSQGHDAVLRPITMVWLFGLPLADLGYLIVGRIARRRNPMRADRRHFHHLLLRIGGLSPGQACWAWIAVAALFVAAGLLGEWIGLSDVTMFVGFWVVFAFYCAVNGYLWSRYASARAAAAQT